MSVTSVEVFEGSSYIQGPIIITDMLVINVCIC